MGALLSGATSEQVEALGRYGLQVGIAFQMADDLLDYTMDTQALGKEAGADLREGKLTLPVIHALKQADSADYDQMVNIIQNEDFTVDEFKTLVGLLEKNDGIAYTKKSCDLY